MPTSARRLPLACLVALPLLLPPRPAGAGGASPASVPAASACFAPGTPPELVDEIGRRLAGRPISLAAPASGFQYQDGARWSATASDGGGLGQGEPTTLTWSYVPDGTALCGYAGEPAAASNLHAWLDGRYGSFAAWHAVFQQVFDRWSQLTGVRYVYEPNDDGSPFGCSSIAPGQLGVRGDLRIAAHLIDDDYGILAYNFFPDYGDMILDSADVFFDDLSRGSLRLRNVLAHEHGHGLGLSHVCPVNGTKLMEPYATTVFDGPQPDDILAANRGYGDDLEDDDAAAFAAALGPLAAGSSLSLSDQSIDDATDVDWLSFATPAPLRVSVTVTPQGSTYLSGPQNDDGSCSAGASFDALTVHDLGVELIDKDGTTVLASASARPAGSSESIVDAPLPAAGTYFVRVFGSATAAAQLYRLDLSAAPLAAPALGLTQALSPAADPHPVGSLLAYTLTASNTGTAPADGVVVRACLDPLLDPAAVTRRDGGLLDQPPAPAGCAGHWITWSLAAPLAVQGSAAVRYDAPIPLAAADGARLRSRAEIASSQSPAQAAAPLDAVVCAPALSLGLTLDRASYVEGDGVTWTLTPSNRHATCALSQVQVSLPVDLTLVEDQPALTWTTPSGAVSGYSGGTITWTLPGLVPGASVPLTVTSRVRAGSAGSSLCSQASGVWSEGPAPAASAVTCAAIAAACPPQGVDAVTALTVVRGPTGTDLTVRWAAIAAAQEYDLWRVSGDKTALPAAGRGAPAPVAAVPGCAFPSPTAAASCVDAGAMALPGLLFYQARGVCGGSEGAP